MSTYLILSKNSTIEFINTPSGNSANEKKNRYKLPKPKNAISLKNQKFIGRKLDFSNFEEVNENKQNKKNSNGEIYGNKLIKRENVEKNENLNTNNSFHSLYPVHPKFDEEYIILKTLSSGQMGTVFLCLKSEDKKTLVVKQCSYSTSYKNDFDKLEYLIKTISNNKENIYYRYINHYIDCWIEDDFGAIDEKNTNLNKYSNNSKKTCI